ncbi:MAG: tail fiber domain-containing protein, partial [Paludibacter sp.]
MKTRILSFTVAILFTLTSYAQLKVLSSGRVETHNQTVVYSNPTNPTDGVDIVGENPNLSNGLDLIWGYFSSLQPNNPGLLTLGSWNGAYFTVRANGNVGIFNNNPGEALEVGTTGTNYQVKINGNLVLTSDERAKENIKDLDSDLQKIKQLRSVSYNLKSIVDKPNQNNFVKNEGGVVKPVFEPKSDKKHTGRKYYGFLAQDLETIFPDLVYKDSAGYLSVDYIGMIPVIVKALNEQSKLIDTQNEKINELETRLTKVDGEQQVGLKKVNSLLGSKTEDVNTLTYPVLEQNNPNPFSVSTSINYYLPEITGNASIYVYDMNGVQLKSYPINQKGKGNIIIQGSEFAAGMYLYALIAD